jgi:hypothetical protein
MGDTDSQAGSISGGAQESERDVNTNVRGSSKISREQEAVQILADFISQRTRSESPQPSQQQQDAELHHPDFEENVKAPFLEFINNLQKSATPLTYLCEQNVQPLYMNPSTAPGYIPEFTIEGNAAAARVNDYVKAEVQQQQQQQEEDFVGGGDEGGDEGASLGADLGAEDEHTDAIGSGLLDYDPLSGGVEQFWAVSYQLAEIYQYFQYFDNTNETLYPVARTKAYLLMLETIKKNSLNSELVKSQFATVMMLPPFLSAK